MQRSFTVSYSLAFFHHLTGNKLNLDIIWDKQMVPEEIQKILKKLLVHVYNYLTGPEASLVSEFAKKSTCWEGLLKTELKLDDDVLKQYLTTTPREKSDYTTDGGDVQEINYYEHVKKITEPGFKFWIGFGKWLISRDDFREPKKTGLTGFG